MRRLPGFLPVPVNAVHCVPGTQDGDAAEQGSASQELSQCSLPLPSLCSLGSGALSWHQPLFLLFLLFPTFLRGALE